MFRIIAIILLATIAVHFVYNTYNSSAEAPVVKEINIAETHSLSDIKPASKKEKVKDIELSVEKIKQEWVVPFKPNFVNNSDKDIKKVENVNDNIQAMASRVGLEEVRKPEELALEEVEEGSKSQFSYLAEPQMKPLSALSKPVSFINPVGGKIVFKPEKALTYSVNSYDILSDKPASITQFAAIDRRNKVNWAANNSNSHKKSSFISSIGLAAAEANQKIANERAALLYVFKRYETGEILTNNERAWLSKLARKYEVHHFNVTVKSKRDELLNRVNVVPESLAVAQAALESGWGSSRIAKEKFNYFGQKCFENCKKTGASYASFNSPREAVEEYIHNLNTHGAYNKFRIAREYLGGNAKGKQLAHYLDGYSTQGDTYEHKVRQVIESNRLE